MMRPKPRWRRGEHPACARCGKRKGLPSFKRVDNGVCRACVKSAEAAAARAREATGAPAVPTVDVVLGRESGGERGAPDRDRLVPVAPIDGRRPLDAAVRLDGTTGHPL